MKNFNVTITKTITYQMIVDLLIAAFEGGSNYWYDELEPLKRTSGAGHTSDKFYEDIMEHGFKLLDKESEVSHEINPEDFEYALKLMGTLHPKHLEDVISENTDASTGDVFLQLLVFNRIIYG